GEVHLVPPVPLRRVRALRHRAGLPGQRELVEMAQRSGRRYMARAVRDLAVLPARRIAEGGARALRGGAVVLPGVRLRPVTWILAGSAAGYSSCGATMGSRRC